MLFCEMSAHSPNAPQDIRVCCSGGVSDEREQQSCRHLVRVGRGHGQTAAQVAASLATALRARGSDRAARSLSLNFAAWPTEESVTVTVMLWREAVAACPLADDLTLHLLDGDKWGGLAFAALPRLGGGKQSLWQLPARQLASGNSRLGDTSPHALCALSCVPAEGRIRRQRPTCRRVIACGVYGRLAGGLRALPCLPWNHAR